MIRTELRMPNMLRLRLRAQLATNQAARKMNGLKQDVVRLFQQGVVARRTLSRAVPSCPSRQVSAEKDQELSMQQFETHYQRLIDLLCWSAKDGVAPDKQARYAELRAWFMSHYDAVRPNLLPYIRGGASGAAQGAPRDAFEQLFWPAKLETLINSDEIIAHIIETRNVVEAWRDDAVAALA